MAERVNTTEASVNDAPKKVPDKLLRIFNKSLQRTGGNLAPDQSRIFAPLRERFSREILKSSTGERLDQFSEILNAIYTDNPTFSATIPILLWCFGARSPELIGSGVVVRVNGLTFLLTAAHVTDYKSKGTYFTTSQQGYTQISGPVSYTHLTLPTSDLV